MTLNISQDLQTFLENLNGAELVGISSISENVGLRLDFTFGPEANDVSLEFYHIIHLTLSQPMYASLDEFSFWVAGVKLRKLGSDGIETLNNLSYPFKSQVRQSDLDDSSLFYFRLVGDFSVVLVCHYYKIFQQLKF
ncbi:MAG TPA: hypothetical protein VIQ31_36530 [Phormidium sp.]